MINQDKFKKIVYSLPDAPGVYLMKDATGEVIYVGKAKSLKRRLGSYLGRDLASKTVALLSRVEDMEYRTTPSEALALLLEAGLVHQYQPRYNVSLRDDKSFPLVKITNEEFPIVCISRKKEPTAAHYFGPFTSAKLLKEALKAIRRYFPYRSCRRFPHRPCLYYRIRLCPAPCIGKIGREEYAQTVENISLFLEGKTNTLMKKLSRQMQLESGAREYEVAAKRRDQINALSAIGRIQAAFITRGEELESLKTILKLKKLPLRIEAFDISNIYGKEATGSMVSFFKGVPDKDNYRRFRIKTVEEIDDYKMISEVVRRRYSRLTEEKQVLPDLILVDGGKGHLLAAKRELQNLGLKIDLISIAKEKENIYSLKLAGPIRLKEELAALNLIRKVRDEAHRFALSYHHILRRKKIIGR